MAEACLGCEAGGNPDTPNIPGPFGTKYDDKEDEIDICLVVPGVKKPKFFGLFGKGNTTIEFSCKEQSLRVYLEIKGRRQTKSTNPEKCLFVVKKLPEKVLPDQANYKVLDNQVVVTLKKEVPGSWKNTLDTYGIDISEQN